MATSNGSHLRLLAVPFFALVASLALATQVAAEVPPIVAQVNNGAQKKVLILHLMRRNDASTLANDRIYQKVLTDGLAGQLDYYSEYIDLPRFDGDDYQRTLRDLLKQKYKGTDFDLIIATTEDMKSFLLRFGRELFGNTPVVFSRSDDRIDTANVPPNFTGVVYKTDLRGTLDVIRRVQPAVGRVFVVTGASETVDLWHEARARKQFKDYAGLEITYWSGLTLEELKRRISKLTPDSVVYFVMMVEDGSGERFAQTGALDQIAAASSVPIYTWYDGFLGHGVVGGKLASSERVASRTAQLALRVLRGEPVESIPYVNADTSRLAFDWGELQRWKLSENSLPADAELLFREQTFWQRYKHPILAVIAVLSIQSALITALLVERRRRRKANNSFKESEARYRNVVESQTDLICRFLPDTTLTFVNDAYCKYFGGTAHELIGTKFILLIPESLRDSTLRYIQSVVDRQPCTSTREHLIIRPDGSSGWQHWTNCVTSTGPGGMVELQGVGRDISERKKLEQQLMRSQREFSTLVENSPDAICRLNRDVCYTYVSPNLEGIFGIPAQAFLGKHPGDVCVSGTDVSGFESRCREAIDTRRATLHECQYQSRYYRTRIIPEFSSDGRVESVMSISEDITERLRVELELRNLTVRLMNLQDEERRRIARELHDGATQNITAILLNLRRMEGVNIDVEVCELISDSQQIATQCLSELRTLSYLLHPPILDHAGLVRAVQWFVRGFSERSGIHIDVGAVQDIGRLPADIETALFRIVQESLTNVHRHSGSSTASIRLEQERDEIKLQISDRGHGMLARTSTGDESELGVGVPGMRQRLTQLGGRLEIQSSEKGTTITAVVPAIQQATLSQRSSV